MREILQAIPEEEIAKSEKTSVEESAQRERLEAEVAGRVRSWSRQWLESFYDQAVSGEDREDFGAKLDFAHSMEAEIAGMVGETDSFNQRLLAPRYREGVGVFLDTLIDFVSEKSLTIFVLIFPGKSSISTVCEVPSLTL